jgi:hypothetical protein
VHVSTSWNEHVGHVIAQRRSADTAVTPCEASPKPVCSLDFTAGASSGRPKSKSKDGLPKQLFVPQSSGDRWPVDSTFLPQAGVECEAAEGTFVRSPFIAQWGSLTNDWRDRPDRWPSPGGPPTWMEVQSRLQRSSVLVRASVRPH